MVRARVRVRVRVRVRAKDEIRLRLEGQIHCLVLSLPCLSFLCPVVSGLISNESCLTRGILPDCCDAIGRNLCIRCKRKAI